MKTVERVGAVTFKGTPLTVLGPVLKIGDHAPDAALTANDWTSVDLRRYDGKVRLINVVSSLDTSICDLQTRRFNQEVAGMGRDYVVLTISADLPWTQKRWCGASGIDGVITLSDSRAFEFGDAYGTHIKEMRIEQRSVFVVDRAGIIRYVEYVPQIAQHPDYDKALAAIRAVGM